MDKNKFVKSTDILVIIVILLTGLLLYFVFGSFLLTEGCRGEILLDKKVIKTFSLDEDTTFSVEEVPEVTFRVKDGAVAFIHSDCPDKICVKTGFINKSGQTAVCLPNRLVLRVVGNKDEDTDGAI